MVDELELRARHLDTVQAIIGRLSQNSFTVRGWSITLATAAFAVLATQTADSRYVLLALVPTWIFWGLDASYVRDERRFRALYNAAARRLNDPAAQPDIDPFDMDTRPFRTATASWVRLMVTRSVGATPTVLTVIIVGYALAKP